MKKPYAARMLDKLLVGDGCWGWDGKHNSRGYAVAHLEHGGQTTAHRVVYEILVGPIPPGLELDHVVCQRHACVNPWHVEAVTHAENVRRERERRARVLICKRGHQRTSDRGRAGCRVCKTEAMRRYREAA